MKNFAAEQLTPMAREATRLLKAMAHPSRLLICCQLREGEMSVGQIEVTLGIRQPNLSRELARLRDDGIVATRRESRVVFYRLDHERAHALIDAICGVMLGSDMAQAATLEAAQGDALEDVVRGETPAVAVSAGESGGAPVTPGGAVPGGDVVAADEVLSRAGGYGVFARTVVGSRGEN